MPFLSSTRPRLAQRTRVKRSSLANFKMTDSAADAEQTALSGASRRPPNAQACPAWRRKRAKPPSPCPQTVGRSPPSVLRAQKATDGKRKGKWQQASCTSLPTTTSTRTWLAVGTTKDRGQRGGGKLRQYGQGGYIHRLRQPKATHAKNKTTHGTRVQNEPTISIARPHASVTSFPDVMPPSACASTSALEC